MPYPVRYECPHCGTMVTLQRSGYLGDKSVTPYPLVGWTYADVHGDYEGVGGIRIVCGEGSTDGTGCGEPYYVDVVRFEDGREVEPDPEPESVELAHPDRPRGPRSPGRSTR